MRFGRNAREPIPFRADHNFRDHALLGGAFRGERVGGWTVLVLGVAAHLLLGGVSAADWLLFPSFESTYEESFDRDDVEDALIPGVDVFYFFNKNDWRLLVEAVVTTEEQEIERLQIGRHLGSSHTLWAGRFHTPISDWNLDLHHGDYLQTSISRPGFVDFEDDGGPFPTHLTGAHLEGHREHHHAFVGYMVSLGVGPVLGETLEPFNVLEPNGKGRFGGFFRLSFRWSAKPDQLSAFVGRLEIPVEGRAFTSIDQELWGLSFTHAAGPVDWIVEVVGARNKLSDGLGATSMLGAYVQAEIPFAERWKLFGRVEGVDGEGSEGKDDPYLALFPTLIEDRLVAGVRVELDRRQALKVEVSRVREILGAWRTVIQAQWSMSISSRNLSSVTK